jgi:glycine/D-amino acid oxidase-like deaminating enzyme
VDILQNTDLIRRSFPQFDPKVQAIIHIRRGGDISGQQLGTVMLEALKEAGCSRRRGDVVQMDGTGPYTVRLQTPDRIENITTDQIVNAAGPFARQVAQMLGTELPLFNTFQQKIAFEDHAGAIPRATPFSIDLDNQVIDWGDATDMIAQDAKLSWLADEMPGAIHCRPDGGDKGRWVKLGWAYNLQHAPASKVVPLDDLFPEIVLRGAARLNPALKCYFGKLPRTMHHYGGWYTMTDENWPLIGPMGPPDSFMACAMSGFGTMAACGSGELCADWVAGDDLPSYAADFSLSRYQRPELMQTLRTANRGVL